CFEPINNVDQQAVISVQIEEYRNGNLIATHIREMQVVVSDVCGNVPPVIGSNSCGSIGKVDSVWGGPSVGWVTGDSATIITCPGDSVNFSLEAFDPNGDNITMTSDIASVLPGSSFDTSSNGSDVTGIGEWLPAGNDTGRHSFTVTVEDDACPISGVSNYNFTVKVRNGVFAGPDQIICGPNSLNPGQGQLSATGGNSYQWSTISGDSINVGNNFSCDTCPNPVATPDTTTVYEVTGSLPAG
ncbi:MAG: hypothetical protein ABEH43_01140, partial [Flavobacteriales bacterium]